MTIFETGAATGFAPRAAEHSYAPKDWLLQHRATRRFMGKSERNNVGAAEIVDTCINLSNGFEGLLQVMTLTGKAATQGPNSGVAWRLFIDRVPYLQTQWQFGAGVTNDGSFDCLHALDGMGNSWGTVDIWLDENAIVEVGIRNNGGTSDPMGWIIWGAYWPTTLRDEYETYRRAQTKARQA